jgi:hypothetical protein
MPPITVLHSPSFPWFSILAPSGSHLRTLTVPGFGEALLVWTSETLLRTYRSDRQIRTPNVVFDDLPQLDGYLHSGFGIVGILLNPDTSQQTVVTSAEVHTASER